MGIFNQGRLAVDAAQNSAKSVWDVFANFSWKNPNPVAPKPVGAIEKGFVGFLKNAVGVPLKVGLKVAEAPIAVMMVPLKWIAAAPGAFFKAFPRFAPVATVVGTVVGVGSWLSHRKSRNLEAQAIAQMQALEAQAGFAPQPSYMNSVSPAETAALDARMQADGKAMPGHAAAVDAARQAPAQSAGAAAAL